MSHYFILQNRCKCKFVVSGAKSDTEHVSNLDVVLYSEIQFLFNIVKENYVAFYFCLTTLCESRSHKLSVSDTAMMKKWL